MDIQDIKELEPGQLTDWLERRDVRPYRAGQILRWIYARQVDDFDAMTDLGKRLRLELREAFAIRRLPIADIRRSADGSQKFLFRLADGEGIESVLIPERDHFTLCISSQVGCAMGCRFCRTGQGGLVRNLSRGEILAQVRDVLHHMGPEDAAQLRNIVFMGMGEPLANYDAVVSAISSLTDTATGFGMASRRITLSTVGLAPRLAELGRDTAVNLAVSLNAVDDDTRSKLMPINQRYPIAALMDACRRYPLRPHRRITFAYILIEGVNDSEKDARQLSRLLHPLRAKINLIPFNDYPGSAFRRSPDAAVYRFQQLLLEKHYTTIIRWSKGHDIAAACGQLRAASGR
ncbi:MAG: 23S rRNA (adenine(2503)-C(2))-methyltransferase RlmN [Desulfobacteraceae bacterium]|nr:23S rRNA (adenine(2503)-C(2))-methyltransferase RlmN [Desulfobacteraceae bacterium]